MSYAGRKALLHVGFPKAGSTWLQRRLFTNASAGFASPWGEQPPMLIEHVRVTDTFTFDENLEEMKAYYQPGFLEAERQGLMPVLSYEHLLVDPMGGVVDRREGVRRISKLFPEAKVLLIIREQKSIIQSAYLEHLRRGFPTKLDRFMGFDELRAPGYGCSCPLELFLYDRLISYLYDVFGKDNVLVLPLEMIGGPDFVSEIYGFLGMNGESYEPAKTKDKQRQARKSDYVFLRSLNYIGMSRYASKGKDSLLRRAAYGLNLALNPLTPTPLYKRKKRVLDDQISGYVSNFYESSNQKTSDLIGVDLGKLGYSV